MEEPMFKRVMLVFFVISINLLVINRTMAQEQAAAATKTPELKKIQLSENLAFHLPETETDGTSVTGTVYKEVAQGMVQAGCKCTFQLYSIPKTTASKKSYISYQAAVPSSAKDGLYNVVPFTTIQHGDQIVPVILKYFQENGCK
jgi:hypothetical protein